MIETVAGLAAVEEIAAVPGVDGVFVGPVDLGLDLGLGVGLATRHPDVLAAVDRCVAAVHAHGGWWRLRQPTRRTPVTSKSAASTW